MWFRAIYNYTIIPANRWLIPHFFQKILAAEKSIYLGQACALGTEREAWKTKMGSVIEASFYEVFF
jgi:hypothetical protein